MSGYILTAKNGLTLKKSDKSPKRDGDLWVHDLPCRIKLLVEITGEVSVQYHDYERVTINRSDAMLLLSMYRLKLSWRDVEAIILHRHLGPMQKWYAELSGLPDIN